MLYKLTLPRPGIESFAYDKNYATTSSSSSSSSSIPTGTPDSLTPIDAIIDSVKDGKNNDSLKMLSKKLNMGKGYLAAKIEKGYVHYIWMMIEKHIKRERKAKGNIMVVNSFDGDLHSSTNTKDSGIISYYHKRRM